MKKQLLLIAALLSAGFIQAKLEGTETAAHPRDAHGRFTAFGGHKRGYHHAGGRKKMTVDEKLAKNAEKITATEEAITALKKDGKAASAELFEKQLKNMQKYRTHLEGLKAAGVTHVGSRKHRGFGWGFGGHKAKNDEVKHHRKTLTDEEKAARKEAREKRKAERLKRQAARHAAVKKTIAEA